MTGRGRLFVGVVAVAQAVVAAFGTLSVAEESNNDAAPQASAKNQGTNEPGKQFPTTNRRCGRFFCLARTSRRRRRMTLCRRGRLSAWGWIAFARCGNPGCGISRDGKKLASISRDSIIIWNAGDGRRLRRFCSRREAAFSRTSPRCPSRPTARKSPRLIVHASTFGKSTWGWNCFHFESIPMLVRFWAAISKSAIRRTGSSWPLH